MTGATGGPHGRSLTLFLRMKQLGVLLLPPGWDANLSQGYLKQVKAWLQA